MQVRFLPLVLLIIFCAATRTFSQNQIAFVSDTQAPMRVETIVLKANQNVRATGLVFHDILSQKPSSVFILGDVVNLGYKKSRWANMDLYLDSCRKAGINVSALLGNHDVMTEARKGEQQFRKRFPDMVKTGFYKVVDSVAVIFLNSNFTKLTSDEILNQQAWLTKTLQAMDGDPAILFIVVTCHHAPYTNSKIVGSAKTVQQEFLPYFIQSKKAGLFMTGHSHNYEHFKSSGKDFLVIGGGGGLKQPLNTSTDRLNDISWDYKPEFHYILLERKKHEIFVNSRFLKKDFSGFQNGISFTLETR